jgi:hypothetical protein
MVNGSPSWSAFKGLAASFGPLLRTLGELLSNMLLSFEVLLALLTFCLGHLQGSESLIPLHIPKIGINLPNLNYVVLKVPFYKLKRLMEDVIFSVFDVRCLAKDDVFVYIAVHRQV